MITIAICTWNRAALLERCLGALSKLCLSGIDDWEVLLVDNHSTDQTKQVAHAYGRRLPLRYVREERLGKSFALNTAAREARGDLIAWTDDDGLVGRRWLQSYALAARKWPEAGFFGGPVEPCFEGTPPRWLDTRLQQVSSAYALRDLGDAPFRFDVRRVPYGVNFAIRTQVQRRYPYDTELGPKGDRALRGEETSLIREMIGDGVEGWWVPSAHVAHFIPRDRQTIRYLRKRFGGEGQRKALCAKRDGRALPMRRRLGVLSRAVKAELGYRFNRLRGTPASWIPKLHKASVHWAMLWGE